MKKSTILFLFLNFYRLIWLLVLPILKKNSRLRQGITERTTPCHLNRADIWIQAASAGECNLAVKLVRNLYFKLPKRILITSTTSQGVGLLSSVVDNSSIHSASSSESSFNMAGNYITITWFPFDMPDLMESVICKVKPALIVLLETELWPSLLLAAKKHGVKVVVINGRMSNKSHKNYMRTRWLWEMIQPDAIFAISATDAQRFRDIFPCSKINVMPNMKFDNILAGSGDSNIPPISNIGIFPANIPVSILASVRQEEEEDVLVILDQILERFPNQVVGLFPRHLHRFDFWRKALADKKYKWVLRSELQNPCINKTLKGLETISSGTVILWDVFGELKSAYSIATVAFVGGSLKPLGGHNFIEPLTSGVATVTGQFIDDFAWVGESIFTDNIVKKTIDKEGVIDFMVSTLKNPPDKKDIIKQGLDYVEKKQGGTAIACKAIGDYLSKNDR